MGVNYGPPPSLLPARPHHTSSAATQGPETRAPDAATAGGFRTVAGPEGRCQTHACRGPPPWSGSRGRRTSLGPQRNGAGLARRAGTAWAQPARAPPGLPYMGPHLVGPPGRPRPCTSTHGDPWKPWRLARCPQPRHTHIPGPGTPCAGYRSTTRRDGARPRPGHAPGRLRWGRDQDSASSASAPAPASQRVVVPRCELAQEGGLVLNALQARSPAFLREIPSGLAPGSGSHAH